jgi:hypothetical protein
MVTPLYVMPLVFDLLVVFSLLYLRGFPPDGKGIGDFVILSCTPLLNWVVALAIVSTAMED